MNYYLANVSSTRLPNAKQYNSITSADTVATVKLALVSIKALYLVQWERYSVRFGIPRTWFLS